METLIIYNKATGEIIYTVGNSGISQSDISGLKYTVSDGKIIKSVDLTTNTPVLIDIPKTDLELANERISLLENYILKREAENTTNNL
jgi:hypothetical protein